MIRVVNRKHFKRAPGEVVINIMRGNTLGNPFRMKGFTLSERNRVCEAFEAWLPNQIAKKGRVYTALKHIADLNTLGCDVALECCCSPLRCHGETIKKACETLIF